MAKRHKRAAIIELPESTVNEIVDSISDTSKRAIVERLSDASRESERIAEAIILAHEKHYGPCDQCDGPLELVRLPDAARHNVTDENGVSIRLGLLKCKCGKFGFVLNPKKGIKP